MGESVDLGTGSLVLLHLGWLSLLLRPQGPPFDLHNDLVLICVPSNCSGDSDVCSRQDFRIQSYTNNRVHHDAFTDCHVVYRRGYDDSGHLPQTDLVASEGGGQRRGRF